MNASPHLESKYRSHTCAALRTADAGKEVRLAGWVARMRDHGGILFVDLRDHYGVTQVVFRGELLGAAQDLRVECVIAVRGAVVMREPAMVNPKVETGEIEVHVASFELLSAAEVVPFQIAEDDNAPEPLRLRYRFLELRRDRLHRNIALRSDVIRAMREIMHARGFREFQTPILTSSSPEGARDYLVPSRRHPGKFFALPQAPQQFKQLLMISGFDRYFQIAPCFRDEDARADRSPGEFYQLDIEMSFVEQEDVFRVTDEIFCDLFSRFTSWKVTEKPFPRITYAESLARFGSDKPDLRNPLEIRDLSEAFAGTGFKVFRTVFEQGGAVRGILVPVSEVPSRKYFDDAVANFQKTAGFGLAYLVFDGPELKGSIAKFVAPKEGDELRARLSPPGKAVLFLVAGGHDSLLALGRLRNQLGREFGLVEPDAYRFCWITDFPFYELDAETNTVQFSHNPFSMPQGGLEALETKDPLTILAHQYDLVCNGYELSSGAIRNHRPEIMYKAFSIVGYSKEEVDRKFGGMINAFKFGAPPHGGHAPGVDRIVMLLAGEEMIREVIAFPLAQNGEDLMMGAPSTIPTKQLDEVHIQVKLPKGDGGV